MGSRRLEVEEEENVELYSGECVIHFADRRTVARCIILSVWRPTLSINIEVELDYLLQPNSEAMALEVPNFDFPLPI